MANEGIAMDWLGEYIKFPQIKIGINAPRMLSEVKAFLNILNQSDVTNRIIYLPNFYPQEYWYYSPLNKEKDFIDIACFGAIRPLKNHMVQAIAAIKYANKFNKKIRFHINSERIEMNGNPVLNNLQGLFQHLADSNHQLIQHKWTCRDQFLDLCMKMDVGLQCNFSETFNIVSADIISQGVPIVSSKEIPWASTWWNADPTDSDDIMNKINLALNFGRMNVFLNQRKLYRYTNDTKKIWYDYFKGE